MAYEFILRHKEYGKKAVVQVKTGNVEMNPEEYKELAKAGKVYLLDLRADKDDTADMENVERLLAEELDAFCNKACLPHARWDSILDEASGKSLVVKRELLQNPHATQNRQRILPPASSNPAIHPPGLLGLVTV